MTDKATPKGAWTVTFLLFLYMLVNFADKIIVGLAGVPIRQELNLTQTQFGDLGASFFYLFSVTAIIVGFIVNRVPTRWVLLVLALIWALVQFPMLGVVSYSTLMICRIILGAGEGPAASVAIHAVYKWFPDEKRTLPTAIISQGSAFGVILAVPALNWVVINYSWHWAFGALGIVGLLWVILWAVLGKEGPYGGADHKTAVDVGYDTVPYWRLLTSPTFIGCCVATFGAYWALSLGLTWFTPFLRDGLGFDQKFAGNISVLPWIFGASVVLLTGWVSQVLTLRGVSTRWSRGVLGSVPLIVGGLTLLLMPYADTPTLKVVVLVFGTGICGSIYVVCAPMIGEFTPTSQRGAAIAIYGAIYTLAGVLAPAINGRVIEQAAVPLDGYLAGFRILALILVAAGIAGLALLWPNTERARLMGRGQVVLKPA